MTGSFSSGCRFIILDVYLPPICLCAVVVTWSFQSDSLLQRLQEPNADSDAQLCHLVNDYLNRPLGE